MSLKVPEDPLTGGLSGKYIQTVLGYRYMGVPKMADPLLVGEATTHFRWSGLVKTSQLVVCSNAQNSKCFSEL